MPEGPQVKVSHVLTQLAPRVGEIARATMQETGTYGCALRAATAKSFEFTSFVWTDPAPTNGFFTTATLRGICEDLIVFSFMSRLDPQDQNRAIDLLVRLNLAESLEAQAAFFQSERPWQPIVSPFITRTEAEKEIREFSAAKLTWRGRQPWPSVWFMARECGLESLYAYLYSASSRWVHFTPHVLLRMGWGGADDDLDDTTEWHFTTINFEKYYSGFNQIYALYMLLRLLRGPAAMLFSGIDIADILSELESELVDELRWPEAVTFEELNLKAPHTIQRVLLRAAYDESTEKPRSV